jgi:hypothetical protein
MKTSHGLLYAIVRTGAGSAPCDGRKKTCKHLSHKLLRAALKRDLIKLNQAVAS